MTTPPDPDRDPDKIRRQRNLVMGLLMGAFVVLVYFVSIARMG